MPYLLHCGRVHGVHVGHHGLPHVASGIGRLQALQQSVGRHGCARHHPVVNGRDRGLRGSWGVEIYAIQGLGQRLSAQMQNLLSLCCT